jgi:hypothetical protein
VALMNGRVSPSVCAACAACAGESERGRERAAEKARRPRNAIYARAKSCQHGHTSSGVATTCCRHGAALGAISALFSSANDAAASLGPTCCCAAAVRRRPVTGARPQLAWPWLRRRVALRREASLGRAREASLALLPPPPPCSPRHTNKLALAGRTRASTRRTAARAHHSSRPICERGRRLGVVLLAAAAAAAAAPSLPPERNFAERPKHLRASCLHSKVGESLSLSSFCAANSAATTTTTLNLPGRQCEPSKALGRVLLAAAASRAGLCAFANKRRPFKRIARRLADGRSASSQVARAGKSQVATTEQLPLGVSRRGDGARLEGLAGCLTGAELRSDRAIAPARRRRCSRLASGANCSVAQPGAATTLSCSSTGPGR